MPDHLPGEFAAVFADPAQPTIIGGQAVNLWAEFYSARAPELAAFRPFVSKDGDVWADRRTVVAIRDRTGWKCQFYDEPRTHAVALLTKEIPGTDEPLRVEVLKDVYGLTHEDLAKSAVIHSAQSGNVRLLEPAPLLKGKIATLASFKVTERPNDARHIRLLIPITRLNFADRVMAAESGTITERDAIASIRYFANLAASPRAKTQAREHDFDFSAALPTDLAQSKSEKIRNFATRELARLRAGFAAP